MKVFKSISILTFLLLLSIEVTANNIEVGNVQLTGQVSGSHTFVKFDLSWENSWKNTTNWDAAWVFVKYKVGSGEWNHATLSSTDTDHSIPSGGGDISTVSDGKGVFVYKSSNGSGNNIFEDVQLYWKYFDDGVANDAQVTVKVFAIEMVYIPQGSFYVGDSVSVDRLHIAGNSLEPFLISSENAITLDSTTITSDPSKLWATGSMDLGSIPAAFPKGYDAFYVMKYEITQGQYVEFLNMLNETQAYARYDSTLTDTIRYTISGSYPNFTTNRPPRACNNLSYGDGAAYADWAGLRPISELEFEKACRGTAAVVAGEFAWGSTYIDYEGDISGPEDGTETVTGDMNTNHTPITGFTGGDGGKGPLRSGIFAASLAPNDRVNSGGSYYGVMELSGNLWETVITCGKIDSRVFNGSHGDGILDMDGDADVFGWPSNALGGRGGGWNNIVETLRVSDRRYINFSSNRETSNGFRCGRTAE